MTQTIKQKKGRRFLFEPEALFATGSSELDTENVIELEKFAEDIKMISTQLESEKFDWAIRVLAHADGQPVEESQNCESYSNNRELSLCRAESVIKFLVEEGDIEQGRLSIAAFGEHHPYNRERLWPNRRVELELVER